MQYDIKAKETRYGGINFRSRLEAKWAAFFDLIGWNWTYEPVDFRGWTPDFVIKGSSDPVYVEVKPIYFLDKQITNKIDASDCADEVLLLGAQGPFWLGYPVVGWMREINENQSWWEGAPMDRFDNNPKIGFCHEYGSFHCRITGSYDGESFGDESIFEEVQAMWHEAHNRTRFIIRG